MSYIGNEPTSVAFLTDTFSGDGSDTTFTLSAAPATTSSILVSITGVLQDPSTYSVSGTTLTFSAAPPTGTSNISVRFLGIPASGVTTTAYRTVTEFTATAGQTSFSVPSYTVGYVDVYRNGVMLGSADYTATTGTTVVLASGATAGDLVEVISFYVSSVLNAIPGTAGSVGTTYLADASVTSAKIASGHTFSLNGVQFPATQVPSADANTLDDYEEGSWTPTIYGSSTAGTYTPSSTRSYYTKIGNQVTIYAGIAFSAASGGSGYAIIGGLPFAYKALTSAIGPVFTSNYNFTSSTPASITIGSTTSASGTTLYIAESIDNAGTNDAPISGISTSTVMYFTLTYTVS